VGTRRDEGGQRGRQRQRGQGEGGSRAGAEGRRSERLIKDAQR